MNNQQKNDFNLEVIIARDLPDSWFLLNDLIYSKGFEYKIDRGSYKGQYRKEADYVVVQINYPGQKPLIPEIPPGLGIPPPTDMEFVNNYLDDLMIRRDKEPYQDYTYAERLRNPKIRINKDDELFNLLKDIKHDRIKIEKDKNGKDVLAIALNVDQVERVASMYIEEGFGTNQATMEIGMPNDVLLEDPPCGRLIDTRVRYGKLHFIVYFRSWDLWGGYPNNMAAIQLMKENMASTIGVEDGKIIASSKGLHLYDHCWELAKTRLGKK